MEEVQAYAACEGPEALMLADYQLVPVAMWILVVVLVWGASVVELA